MKMLPEKDGGPLFTLRERVRRMANVVLDKQPAIIAIPNSSSFPEVVRCTDEMREILPRDRDSTWVVVVGMDWLIENQPELAASVAFDI